MAIDIEAPGADEADLKAAIQALANEIVVVTLSASTTLDSTYYSKLVEVDTAAVVITFPAAPATEQTLDVVNTSAGSITVNGLTVAAGKTVGHISIGSAWVEITPNVSGSYTDEEARDAIGTALIAGNGIEKAVSDGSDTITISTVDGEAYLTGRYYLPANYETLQVAAASTAWPASTTMLLMPILFRDGLTIDTIGVQISTLSASGNFQLYLYAMDPATLAPTGAPIYSSTSQSTAATGFITIGSLSIAVTAGWYWLAAQADNSAVIFRVAGTSVQTQPTFTMALVGAPSVSAALSTNNQVRQLTKTGVTFGSPPTLTGNMTTDALNNDITDLRVPAITFKGT